MELYDDKYVSLLPDEMALCTALLNDCIKATLHARSNYGKSCWAAWVWWCAEDAMNSDFKNAPVKSLDMVYQLIYYNRPDENIAPENCILQCKGCAWCN